MCSISELLSVANFGNLGAVLRILIHRIRMFLGLLDPNPAPDPSIIKQKE